MKKSVFLLLLGITAPLPLKSAFVRLRPSKTTAKSVSASSKQTTENAIPGNSAAVGQVIQQQTEQANNLEMAILSLQKEIAQLIKEDAEKNSPLIEEKENELKLLLEESKSFTEKLSRGIFGESKAGIELKKLSQKRLKIFENQLKKEKENYSKLTDNAAKIISKKKQQNLENKIYNEKVALGQWSFASKALLLTTAAAATAIAADQYFQLGITDAVAKSINEQASKWHNWFNTKTPTAIETTPSTPTAPEITTPTPEINPSIPATPEIMPLTPTVAPSTSDVTPVNSSWSLGKQASKLRDWLNTKNPTAAGTEISTPIENSSSWLDYAQSAAGQAITWQVWLSSKLQQLSLAAAITQLATGWKISQYVPNGTLSLLGFIWDPIAKLWKGQDGKPLIDAKTGKPYQGQNNQ